MGTTSSVRRRRRPGLRRGAACTAPTETELFAAARDGDAVAREELVRRFLPMARRLAWRYRRGGEPLDDLVQVASVALVKALERFDHEPRRAVLRATRCRRSSGS